MVRDQPFNLVEGGGGGGGRREEYSKIKIARSNQVKTINVHTEKL